MAPSGIPAISTLSVSEPSVSVREEAIDRSIGVSSTAFASASVSVGASASAATFTSMVPEVVAVSPPSPSVDVAVTVSWKSTSLSAGAWICRLPSCAGSTLATPLVTEMTVPSVRDRVAPSGIPAISTLSVSEPSVSVREDATLSGIGVSSTAFASPSVSVGASASAATFTSMVPEVVAVSPPSPSVDVAVTVSWKSTSLSAGAWICRLPSCAGSTLATPLVTEITVPSVRDKVAPSGIPAISTLSVSEPSVSVREEAIDRSIGVSSTAFASATVRSGASATAFTSTVKDSWSVKTSPPSRVCATSVRLMSSSESSGGKIRMSGFCKNDPEISALPSWTLISTS